jgi:RNA polymerase sigma-B factor
LVVSMLAVSAHARRDRRDELRLARYARTRDRKERERLVTRYMPLARRLAAHYRNVSEPREDLLQVATIGLILAIDRYDPGRGSAFTSFAVPTILGELRRHLRDHTWAVHVPRDTRELADRLPAVADQQASRLGRPPTVAELAARLGRSAEDIRDARAALACRTVTSLDQPLSNDRETLADSVDGGDGGVGDVHDRVVVDQLLAELSPRRRAVVRLHFQADLTQREIADRLRMSPTHIGRLLRESLETLRERSAAASIAPVLIDRSGALSRRATWDALTR